MKCNNESVRKTLALTLTLSPRRGDSRSPRWEGPLKGRSFRTARQLLPAHEPPPLPRFGHPLPLRGGEGRGEGVVGWFKGARRAQSSARSLPGGEGERLFPLPTHGLARPEARRRGVAAGTKRISGSGTVWWGEATDEPARADAGSRGRTPHRNCKHVPQPNFN